MDLKCPAHTSRAASVSTSSKHVHHKEPYPMFSLDRAKVKIIAVTAISELHGNERKPACCITFEMMASSLYLSEFDSALRGMLYSKETQPSKQGALDIDEELGGLTALRF